MTYKTPGKVGSARVRMLDTAEKALRFNGIGNSLCARVCDRTHTYFPAQVLNRADYEAVERR